MLVCFTFEAKPGKEAEFESALSNAEWGRKIARAMGATRNMLFVKGGRMIRVLEFPQGVTPLSLAEIAKKDKEVELFLRRLAPLIKDGYDPDLPETIASFNHRASVTVAYDVHA